MKAEPEGEGYDWNLSRLTCILQQALASDSKWPSPTQAELDLNWMMLAASSLNFPGLQFSHL